MGLGVRPGWVVAAAGAASLIVGSATLAGKRARLQVRTASLSFIGEGCCQTLLVTPSGAGKLLVDTRDACDSAGHQWRVLLQAPGRKGVRSNFGSGTCNGADGARDTADDWSGLARMRVKAPGPYRVTVCHEGGSGAYPANMDVRMQYAGPDLTVDGPLPCGSCYGPGGGTTTTTVDPLATTTTTGPPACVTTTTIQPCGGDLGVRVISTTGPQQQVLVDSVPVTGMLELTISGTICHGGSFDCEHNYDYEFWLNDPLGPSHVTNVYINGGHRIPDGAPSAPTSNHTYVVQLPVVQGEQVIAVDNDSVYSDNYGFYTVSMNLVCP